jgi:hypothetical protein
MMVSRSCAATALTIGWFGRVARAAAVMGLACVAPSLAFAAAPNAMIDLEKAMVVAPAGLSGPERKAVVMLVEEVARRTRIRWEVLEDRPKHDGPLIFVGTPATLKPWAVQLEGGPAQTKIAGLAEGYRVWINPLGNAPVVMVVGNDARGVLFGIGRLLRELEMGPRTVALRVDFGEASAPRYPVRGHQLGYRPKTNSYDAWNVAEWEQYIRDLAVFGTNIVELIPPKSDDAADSPHFPLPPMEMMVAMSRLLDQYGLDVGIWYPAIEGDYGDPKVVEKTLASWDEVFRKLPRVDAVFVPGGDPGHSRPYDLMAFLEKATAVLHKSHPKAGMWLSPQGFDRAWFDEFYGLMKQRPRWLAGLVYGPHTRDGLAEIRANVPEGIPIRLYPDITHTMKCQFPVQDWDLSFWLTEGREPVNPRPRAYTTMCRAVIPGTVGFVSYSEGCNDDVNKIVWNALAWDPEASTLEVLRQYARYFIGPKQAEGFAQGLLALEQGWDGPLLGHASIDVTLEQFRDIERRAEPSQLQNWRFQQPLYRAYYDAYVKDRLEHETAVETRARAALRRAETIGSVAAMAEAEAILADSARPISTDRRARLQELASALFQSIHMQLSVEKYRAIGQERGANLDAIDAPLNSRVWLQRRFNELRKLPTEPERLRALQEIVNWTDPGPGGFYDALGDPRHRPHLVAGLGPERDPMLRRQRTGFHKRPEWPLEWCRIAESLYDAPLEMHYDELEPSAGYRVRIVYTGDNFATRVKLMAEGLEVHPLIKKPDPVAAVEFDIPAAATADGKLDLTWTQEPGRGGNGRGCQVAEVWLIRK